MIDPRTAHAYRQYRAEHPMVPARYALSVVAAPDLSVDWQEGPRTGDTWTREVDGFTVTLSVEVEYYGPIPDRHGSTTYGSYVQEVATHGSFGLYDEHWGGDHPRPAVSAPLGLPYTSIRFEGISRSDDGGYFIPDGVEDTFANFRAMGQSKSVAWDLTRADVEAQLKMLFGSPLTNLDVTITVEREGIELARESMGTDVAGDELDYVFAMAEEYGMVDEAIDDARAAIARLTESA